ncbi:MAG: helix-turn-helix transcriptional regulator [Candidatus Tectomicrobia bacterium]|uniref:Helix-turn-helix transcriptional regulator n=1 Tax=Tectimicrobiota bacterium TaxID=2528274 RepID=A0A932HXX9_UNCTE|nr:helix-turn-helix transcriptional regulator [Candidatus Tectomicrobia bacterium]
MPQGLFKLRKEAGLSREKLGAKAQISARTIYRIEKFGDIPAGDTVARLAAALEKSEAEVWAAIRGEQFDTSRETYSVQWERLRAIWVNLERKDQAMMLRMAERLARK